MVYYEGYILLLDIMKVYNSLQIILLYKTWLYFAYTLSNIGLNLLYIKVFFWKIIDYKISIFKLRLDRGHFWINNFNELIKENICLKSDI